MTEIPNTRWSFPDWAEEFVDGIQDRFLNNLRIIAIVFLNKEQPEEINISTLDFDIENERQNPRGKWASENDLYPMINGDIQTPPKKKRKRRRKDFPESDFDEGVA